jgi:hypothetical protein
MLSLVLATASRKDFFFLPDANACIALNNGSCCQSTSSELTSTSSSSSSVDVVAHLFDMLEKKP